MKENDYLERILRARVYDVERNLLRRPDGPRRITNLWHLLELLSEVAARFDRPPVPPGRVSLTFRLVFQDPSRTLTGEEIQAAMDAVAAALRARGHEIRGE